MSVGSHTPLPVGEHVTDSWHVVRSGHLTSLPVDRLTIENKHIATTCCKRTLHNAVAVDAALAVGRNAGALVAVEQRVVAAAAERRRRISSSQRSCVSAMRQRTRLSCKPARRGSPLQAADRDSVWAHRGPSSPRKSTTTDRDRSACRICCPCTATRECERTEMNERVVAPTQGESASPLTGRRPRRSVW